LEGKESERIAPKPKKTKGKTHGEVKEKSRKKTSKKRKIGEAIKAQCGGGGRDTGGGIEMP